MGTNYYIKGHRLNNSPKYHIGKRSAAGLYCWDCKITLCIGGEEKVHYDVGFFSSCPKCGKIWEGEKWEESSIDRELGLNRNPSKIKTGVRGCSSFTWARPLGRIQKIVDEYGREYTRAAFAELLKECPIQYKRYGLEFS